MASVPSQWPATPPAYHTGGLRKACGLVSIGENGAKTPRPRKEPFASSWHPMQEPAKRARVATSSGVSPVPTRVASSAVRTR